MTPRRRSLSLMAVLCASLLCELLARRLGTHLADELPLSHSAQDVLQWSAAFSFHLSSLLSLLLAGLAIMRLLAQPVLIPAGGRPLEVISRAVSVVAMVGFLFISALSLWQPLPDQLRIYLLALFAIVIAQLVRGGWPSLAARPRVKAWLLLLVAAVLARVAAQAIAALGLEGRLPMARALVPVGEALAATLAATAPLTLLTRRSPRGGPMIVGLLVTASALLVWLRDPALGLKVADYGFGVVLPPSLFGVALESLALGAWAVAVVALVAQSGTPRLRGWGLLALGLSGFHLVLSYQLCSSMLGVLCIVESYLREQATLLPQPSWQRLVRRLAAGGGASEAIVMGAPGFEEARASGSVDGEPVELLVERRGGMLVRLEIAVGHAPGEEAPPLSLLRRGMPRLGRREGAEVATGDLDFDAAFLTFDARRLAATDPVLDDSLRPRLRSAIDGWLGVWPGRGARLRSVAPTTFTALLDEGANPDEALRALVALLLEVRRRG